MGLNSEAIERATRAVASKGIQGSDELAEPFVELSDQKAVEAHAVLEKPKEGAAVHQRQRVSRSAITS